jgi:hypothetical protein
MLYQNIHESEAITQTFIANSHRMAAVAWTETNGLSSHCCLVAYPADGTPADTYRTDTLVLVDSVDLGHPDSFHLETLAPETVTIGQVGVSLCFGLAVPRMISLSGMEKSY